MAISYIASGTGITSVSTMPSHAAGDYLIGCAFRDGNNTAPTLPAGWTELPSGSSLGAGSNSNGMRLAYKVASSSSETSGTWSSATSLNIDVYRGVGSIGNVTQNEGNGTSINYPANTFTVTDGTSWAVLYGGHRSANTDIEVPPTGATNRSDNADATDELATHDTNGGVTSWSSTNQTLTGTSSGWRTVVVELVAAGATNYTLTAAKGTFTLTGQAANLKAARTLPAAAGSFTLTGQAANLRTAKTVTASPAAFTLTGQAATLRRSLSLTAATGSFILGGQTVSLKVARVLSASAGSFTFAGQAATLTYTPGTTNYTLIAETGVFTLTGRDAALLYSGSSGGQAVTIDYGESYYSLRRKRKKKVIKKVIHAIAEKAEAPTAEDIEWALSDILISVDNVEKNTRYQESTNALIRAEVERKQKEIERAHKQRQEQAAWLAEFAIEQERLAAEEAAEQQRLAEFAELSAAVNKEYKKQRNKKRALMIAAMIDAL